MLHEKQTLSKIEVLPPLQFATHGMPALITTRVPRLSLDILDPLLSRLMGRSAVPVVASRWWFGEMIAVKMMSLFISVA